MKDLKRRGLHDEGPTTRSEPEDQVDNRTLICEQEAGYEEGTSSSGEQEAIDDETPPGTPEEPADLSRRQSIPPFGPDFTQESAQHSRHEQLTSNNGNGLLYGAAVAGILVGCFFAYVWAPAPGTFKTCAFKSLRNSPPQQSEKVWLALQKGIEGLINKKDIRPSVFLFLHQDAKLQKLINAIAAEASECYGK